MAQLRQDHPQFIGRNIEVILIGPDSPEAFQQYWAKEGIPYRGLSDAGGGVLAALGQEVNLLKLGRMPAQLLIDSHGIVRFAYYGASMSDIPAPARILAWFDAELREPLAQP